MIEKEGFFDRRRRIQLNGDIGDDEISLYDLYAVLLRRKKTILVTAAAILVACTIYLFITPKTYQVSAILLPPAPSDLHLTNLDASYESKQVFEGFQTELKLNEVWNKFIHKNKFLSAEIVEGDWYENPLSFGKDKDFPGPHLRVKYDSGYNQNAPGILRDYINYTKEHYTQLLLSQEKKKNDRQIDILDLDIRLAREHAKKIIEDQVMVLENDLAIAKKLDIKGNNFLSRGERTGDPKSLNIFTNDLRQPGYLKGTRILTAEIEQLKQRQSDDVYIGGLRDKQAQLGRLKAIQYVPESFKPFQLDGEVSAPRKIKPKTKLVLVLGVILGFMLGIFAAFIAEFIQKAHQTRS